MNLDPEGNLLGAEQALGFAELPGSSPRTPVKIRGSIWNTHAWPTCCALSQWVPGVCVGGGAVFLVSVIGDSDVHVPGLVPENSKPLPGLEGSSAKTPAALSTSDPMGSDPQAREELDLSLVCLKGHLFYSKTEPNPSQEI